MTTPSKPEELLEIAERQAGTDAMQMLVDKHLDILMELREQMAIDDIDLLSSNIATNKRIDRAVKDRITSLHATMRKLIEVVAQKIEDQKYKSSEEAIQGFRSLKEKEKFTRLLSADKKTHVSCQSLRVAVDVFYELNKQIVEKLDSATHIDPAEEHKLFLGNSLLVYELTDFAIHFIEGFRLQGLDEIEAIYKDMQKEIADLREEANLLRKQAESPKIDEQLRQQTMSAISDRDGSIKVLEKEWSSYMQTVRSHKGEIGSVTEKIPGLQLIRDNAKAQINVLAAVSVLQIVQSNHPLRHQFNEAVSNFIRDLGTSDKYSHAIEEMRQKFITSTGISDFLNSTWRKFKSGMLAGLADSDSELRRRLVAFVGSAGLALQKDDAFRHKLDKWIVSSACGLVRKHGNEIGEMIRGKFQKWDPTTAAQLLEDRVGDDLQYIRINGALVGGFVGLVLYLLDKFLLEKFILQ